MEKRSSSALLLSTGTENVGGITPMGKDFFKSIIPTNRLLLVVFLLLLSHLSHLSHLSRPWLFVTPTPLLSWKPLLSRLYWIPDVRHYGGLRVLGGGVPAARHAFGHRPSQPEPAKGNILNVAAVMHQITPANFVNTAVTSDPVPNLGKRYQV